MKKCVDNGRTPVILTRYKEHASLLSERLQAYADNLFLLSGDKSQKELQRIRRQMEQVSPNETMILVATGHMVGEGFARDRERYYHIKPPNESKESISNDFIA